MAEPWQAVSCQNDFNIFNVSSVQHLLITNVIAPSNPQNSSKVTMLNCTKLRDVVAVKCLGFATIRQQQHQTMRVHFDLC